MAHNSRLQNVKEPFLSHLEGFVRASVVLTFRGHFYRGLTAGPRGPKKRRVELLRELELEAVSCPAFSMGGWREQEAS
jgi:hypothetical protein